jgi:hypothetical protein
MLAFSPILSFNWKMTKGELILVFFSIIIFNWKMNKGELYLSSFPFSSSNGK